MAKRPAPRRAPKESGGTWDTAIYRLARAATAGRANSRCEGCGLRQSTDVGHAHHRKLRSQGGPDSPANLLWLCNKCHSWAHRRITAAREIGWIVPSWADPYNVPVKVRDGVWWLRGNGTRDPVAEGAFPLQTGDTATTTLGDGL